MEAHVGVPDRLAALDASKNLAMTAKDRLLLCRRSSQCSKRRRLELQRGTHLEHLQIGIDSRPGPLAHGPIRGDDHEYARALAPLDQSIGPYRRNRLANDRPADSMRFCQFDLARQLVA